MNVLLLVLSSRTKRSEVKDLVLIHVDVLETLRYALDDNTFIQHADKTTALKQGTVPTTSRKPFS